MTQDEIFAMARQSDLGFLLGDNWMMHHEFVAFAHLVAAKATEEANARANASWALMCKKMVAFEREACAILCDNRSSFFWNWQAGNLQKHEENRHYAKASEECADAIRARGQA